MIFHSKKRGGGHFFDIFDTRPHPPHLTENLKKVGFKWGGPDQKLIGGCVCWTKKMIMILQKVKPTIQPLGVGYANSPKKAKMGAYVAFSPIYACLALI